MTRSINLLTLQPKIHPPKRNEKGKGKEKAAITLLQWWKGFAAMGNPCLVHLQTYSWF